MVSEYKGGWAVFTASGQRVSKTFTTKEDAERWERLLTKAKPVEE